METLISIINSPVFKRFVVSPLAVIGFFQIFRGVTTIMERDIAEHELNGSWVLKAYIAITILGCICLVLAL